MICGRWGWCSLSETELVTNPKVHRINNISERQTEKRRVRQKCITLTDIQHQRHPYIVFIGVEDTTRRWDVLKNKRDFVRYKMYRQ